MRFIMPMLVAVTLAGAAVAQPVPRVTIEDDVSPANALKCAGLRLAQSERKPDARVEAARDAWLQSGVDAAKAKVEAARFSMRENADLAAAANECEPFEIKSGPPAGG
jgi:hypothetical protein